MYSIIIIWVELIRVVTVNLVPFTLSNSWQVVLEPCYRMTIISLVHLVMSFSLSSAHKVHGGDRAGCCSLLQQEGQDSSREAGVCVRRSLWPCLCPAEEPLLPQELPYSRRLDGPHLVGGSEGVVHHLEQVTNSGGPTAPRPSVSQRLDGIFGCWSAGTRRPT